MFGIGMTELLFILVVALIVIGPKKLPDLAKSLGRALGEFKRATNDLKETLEIDHEISEVKKAFSGVKDGILNGMDASMDSEQLIGKNGSVPEANNLSKLKSAFDDFNESGRVSDATPGVDETEVAPVALKTENDVAERVPSGPENDKSAFIQKASKPLS